MEVNSLAPAKIIFRYKEEVFHLYVCCREGTLCTLVAILPLRSPLQLPYNATAYNYTRPAPFFRKMVELLITLENCFTTPCWDT